MANDREDLEHEAQFWSRSSCPDGSPFGGLRRLAYWSSELPEISSISRGCPWYRLKENVDLVIQNSPRLFDGSS